MHRISHIVNHPFYKDRANDIALIRLAKPVKFTKDIKLICLPSRLSDSEIFKTFNYCIQSSIGEIDRGMEHCFFIRLNIYHHMYLKKAVTITKTDFKDY